MNYLTVKEIALRARCHPETVRQALRDGTLRGTQRVVGGNWLATESAVAAWLGEDEEQVAA